MTANDWLWLGFGCMAVGSAALCLLGLKRRTRDEENHWVLHFTIPIIATASYFAMANGQGILTLADGRSMYYARYIDWALTTPLLLTGLILTALGSPFRRWAVLLGLMLTDVFMIATGAFASASPSGSIAKWVWYLMSCGAFAFIYVSLFGTLGREADKTGAEAARVFKENRLILAVLWLIYPINFLLGPEGIGRIDFLTSTAVYTVLDVVAKVAYGYYSLRNTQKRTTRELTASEIPTEDLRPAPAAYQEVHELTRTTPTAKARGR